ncbi:MAG: group II truncated hemoglobin [Enhygromyxa sp.]
MSETPYEMLGGSERVLALVKAFYDVMEEREPALAATHQVDEQGRISPTTRERFGLFLIGWLGGPQDYMQRFGHPRLRMRHAHVPIDTEMRDAWLRCMQAAMDGCEVRGPVRGFLDQRFAEVADFLRNRPG